MLINDNLIPGSTPALDDDDLGSGIYLESAGTATSPSVGITPYVSVLREDFIHVSLRFPVPHKFLSIMRKMGLNGVFFP